MMEHESTFDSYPEPVSPDILERLYDPNIRLWRDAFEKRLVTMGTAILAEGCRDWGMPDGKRRVYKNCTFCLSLLEILKIIFMEERLCHLMRENAILIVS